MAATEINYIPFSEIVPKDFARMLNNHKIRAHLVEHALFNEESLAAWMREKIAVDATKGCRVRGILVNVQLAGWCGIQLEQETSNNEEMYEVAIVLDQKYWGIGKQVFQEMMRWAKDLGHNEIFIHFLETRREYLFLKKIAKQVFESERLGRRFTTYRLSVQ